MSGMSAVKSLRDETGDGLPQGFRCWAEKNPFGSAVEEHDPLLFIDGDDRIRGRLNDAREAAFAFAQCGGALGHASFQVRVQSIDLGASPGADADLAADGGPGNGEENHARQGSQRDERQIEALCGTGAASALLQQTSFRFLHFCDGGAGRIHELFAPFELGLGGGLSCILPNGYHIPGRFDPGPGLLFECFQAPLLIGIYNQKA